MQIIFIISFLLLLSSNQATSLFAMDDNNIPQKKTPTAFLLRDILFSKINTNGSSSNQSASSNDMPQNHFIDSQNNSSSNKNKKNNSGLLFNNNSGPLCQSGPSCKSMLSESSNPSSSVIASINDQPCPKIASYDSVPKNILELIDKKLYHSDSDPDLSNSEISTTAGSETSSRRESYSRRNSYNYFAPESSEDTKQWFANHFTHLGIPQVFLSDLIDEQIKSKKAHEIKHFFSISATHGCAIQTTGHGWCWGDNRSQQTSIPENLGAISVIKTGHNYSCAIKKKDSKIQCWGEHPALKDPDHLSLTSLGPIKSLYTNADYACVIEKTYKIKCWGNSLYYNSPYDISKVPENIGPVSFLSSGLYHTCLILKKEKTVKCWGDNVYDQLTVPDTLGSVTALSTGSYHSCAIKKTDNTVVCWGNNNEGQTDVPEDLGAVIALNSGTHHSCAIRQKDRHMQCWGSYMVNSEKQKPYESNKAMPSHIIIPEDLGPVLVMANGTAHSCAIKQNEMMECWGNNTYGQSTVPSDLGKVSSIHAEKFSTCAVSSQSAMLRCWGRNFYNHEKIDVPTTMGSIKNSYINSKGKRSILKQISNIFKSQHFFRHSVSGII